MPVPARLLLLFCLSTPVAALNWNEMRSRLKGAAHCCGVPARAAKSAWAPRTTRAVTPQVESITERARSARAPRSAERAPVQQTTGFRGELSAEWSLPLVPLQANSVEAEADFGGWLRIGLLLWLAGLSCAVFLVGRLWFTYSGFFFNWLLRGALLC